MPSLCPLSLSNWIALKAILDIILFSSVSTSLLLLSHQGTFSSATLRTQHARPPRPLPSPRASANSCPLSRWCHPTSSSSVVPFSPTFNLSQHQGFFLNESALRIRCPQYWNFSFSTSPSNKHSGLIFRMDWLDLLAVQGTLKSLVQHHSSKASILPCSAFFIVQLSHPYMSTGKTIALTRQTFVGKVMSLLFKCCPGWS